MARYGLGLLGTRNTINLAQWDIANASTGVRAVITELAWSTSQAVATTMGLNRATTLGTRTTPTAVLGQGDGDPALTGITLVDCALAWTGEPTQAAAFHRRFAVPATIGLGRVWTFPAGFRIAPSLGVLLVNLVAGSLLNVEVEVEV